MSQCMVRDASFYRNLCAESVNPSALPPDGLSSSQHLERYVRFWMSRHLSSRPRAPRRPRALYLIGTVVLLGVGELGMRGCFLDCVLNPRLASTKVPSTACRRPASAQGSRRARGRGEEGRGGRTSWGWMAGCSDRLDLRACLSSRSPAFLLSSSRPRVRGSFSKRGGMGMGPSFVPFQPRQAMVFIASTSLFPSLPLSLSSCGREPRSSPRGAGGPRRC
ncbi:hypothetical protein LZ30DRAFT_296743 [Colletotrichum cereale]|nr:hypothetical protein LZ30DRAFT_296743 [Colletotrichum cereale]